MMANFGEGLEENQRLMTHETWLKMHANEKRAFDAAMHGIKSYGITGCGVFKRGIQN